LVLPHGIYTLSFRQDKRRSGGMLASLQKGRRVNGGWKSLVGRDYTLVDIASSIDTDDETGDDNQAHWIAGQIYEAARHLRLPVNAAAVLVYSSSVGEPLAEALSSQGLPARFMNSSQFDLDEPCIKVTTLHAAKGLEFPIVVVAHVEAGRLPRETEATDPEEVAAHLAEQRRLFYVGCTRAMRHLFVTYDHQIPSPFLADLSDERWQRM